MNYMKAGNEDGYVPGKHLSAYFQAAQEPKWADRLDQVIESLLDLIDATEEDSLFTGQGVAPVYYEELAIIFRAQKDYAKEVQILTRYDRQRHSYGDTREKILKARLEKARKLLLNSRSTG